MHKATVCVAIAESGRGGEVREVGAFENRPDVLRKMVARLGKQRPRLNFCYEAGLCGYGLHRLLIGLGHDCVVVAPSLIPMKAGDRMKTDHRDTLMLAKLHRAGELTPIWISAQPVVPLGRFRDDPAPNGVCRRSLADDLHVFGRAHPSSNVSRGGIMHAQAEANDCKSCGLQQVRHSRSPAAVASGHGRQMWGDAESNCSRECQCRDFQGRTVIRKQKNTPASAKLDPSGPRVVAASRNFS
ncbi:hypothetical protein [Nitrobacter hamburgensis]|uniref:hypothetical protein n=1 Tax=Nitrobacter hamburgensis TaxID=912 RepID=UPI002698CDA7